MPLYEVQELDCIDSIAFEHGFFPETIWNHPENADLRNLRKNRNILEPGDLVFVPEKEMKHIPKPTDQKHRFVRKAVPTKISFQVLKRQEPVKFARYALAINGRLIEGMTGGDGLIEAPIPPNARDGELRVWDGEDELFYPLRLGGLDPIESMNGLQARLENLGYAMTPDTRGETGEEGAKAALAMFQRDHGLSVTGQLDESTRAKLKAAYGN